MTYGLLNEDREEQKYPKWFRYLGILYAVVLMWTIFSVPPLNYDIGSILVMVLVWLPVPIGLLYILEKPAALGKHKKVTRIIFALFAAIAIFWGIVLSYTFF